MGNVGAVREKGEKKERKSTSLVLTVGPSKVDGGAHAEGLDEFGDQLLVRLAGLGALLVRYIGGDQFRGDQFGG